MEKNLSMRLADARFRENADLGALNIPMEMSWNQKKNVHEERDRQGMNENAGALSGPSF
jgi:hypothetical protein